MGWAVASCVTSDKALAKVAGLDRKSLEWYRKTIPSGEESVNVTSDHLPPRADATASSEPDPLTLGGCAALNLHDPLAPTSWGSRTRVGLG